MRIIKYTLHNTEGLIRLASRLASVKLALRVWCMGVFKKDIAKYTSSKLLAQLNNEYLPLGYTSSMWI